MTVFTRRVSATADDCYQYNGSVSYNLVLCGLAGGLVVSGGMRFINISIPKGANITNAFITFTEQSRQGGTASMRIVGAASDNTPIWSSSFAPESIPIVEHYIDWVSPFQAAESVYDSPDIKSIIQDIVNRPGWVLENSLSIALRNNGSPNGTYLYDYGYGTSPTKAALLTVEWDTGGGSSSSNFFNFI